MLNQLNTPKRKRTNRKQRLQIAKDWLPQNNGKNVVKSYANWFGVEKLCAIAELRLLGVNISPEYEEHVEKDIKATRTAKIKRQNKKIECNRNPPIDLESDDYFALIVGRTSGGAAYGVSWEEMGKTKSDELNNYGDKNEGDYKCADDIANTDNDCEFNNKQNLNESSESPHENCSDIDDLQF